MVSRISRRVAGAGLIAILGVAGGCRGRAPQAAGDADIQFLVDSLTPLVEVAVGLEFREPPRWAIRSSEQLQEFLTYKFREQLPPDVLVGVQSAYQLFGLIPDSLDLEALFLDVLSEQVQGFYEPDSTTLFLVDGAPIGTRITVAHELVHALQDQYLPLDSLMDPRRANDRLVALQAILEGQAQHASVSMMAGDQVDTPGFWEMASDQAREMAAGQMADVPLIIREELLFPYLDGARFIEWWSTSAFADTMPYGPRLPVSTEQVLHPSRYLAGDVPLDLAFVDSARTVLYQDGLGEFEIRVLHAQLLNDTRATFDAPIGWNGDHYRVYESPDGPALVWYIAWDDARHADRFLRGTGSLLGDRERAGYRTTVARVDRNGVPVARVVIAPNAWDGWEDPPAIRILP